MEKNMQEGQAFFCIFVNFCSFTVNPKCNKTWSFIVNFVMPPSIHRSFKLNGSVNNTKMIECHQLALAFCNQTNNKNAKKAKKKMGDRV